jgi:hypothetical protein
VVCEHLDVLTETLGMQALKRLENGGVQGAAPLLQYTAVRNLVGERVLERVLDVREKPCLVQKLRRL